MNDELIEQDMRKRELEAEFDLGCEDGFRAGNQQLAIEIKEMLDTYKGPVRQHIAAHLERYINPKRINCEEAMKRFDDLIFKLKEVHDAD